MSDPAEPRSLHDLIAQWQADSHREHGKARDDIEDGIWAYQHESYGKHLALSACADDLAAWIARQPQLYAVVGTFGAEAYFTSEAQAELYALEREDVKVSRVAQLTAGVVGQDLPQSGNDVETSDLMTYMTTASGPERDASWLRMYAEKIRNGTAWSWEIPSTVAGTMEAIASRVCAPPVIPTAARPQEQDEQLKRASQFIRDVIEAIGFEQPDLDAVVDLEELRLCLVGQIEELKVAAAARRGGELPPPWRDIETAPKDDTIVIGFDPTRDDFDPEDNLGHGVEFMRWRDGSWIDPSTHTMKPTHWMPLPEPPRGGDQAPSRATRED